MLHILSHTRTSSLDNEPHRYHAMLEVEYCNRPYSTLQKLQFMYKTHAAKGPDATPQSFILDTSLTSQASGNEEWKRRSGRPLECPESVVSRLEGKRKLSVAERNELWLAKKKVKAAKFQSLAEEKNMQERAKSAPDLSRSRQSFTSIPQESDGPADVVAVAQKRASRIVTKRSITTADPRRSSVARKRSIATADPNRCSRTVASRRSIVSTGQRQPSMSATRKRSITTADPNANLRSLGNITNQTEAKRRKKQKIGPISDPFTRKEMVR